LTDDYRAYVPQSYSDAENPATDNASPQTDEALIESLAETSLDDAELAHVEGIAADESVVEAEPAQEAVAPAKVGIFAGLLGSRSAKEAQYRELSYAIERRPSAPSNFVLRGEVALKLRDYEGAAQDFRHALALAQAEMVSNRWGVIAQAMQDRALDGLRIAERKLGLR
jgi:hypothetical protein